MLDNVLTTSISLMKLVSFVKNIKNTLSNKIMPFRSCRLEEKLSSNVFREHLIHAKHIYILNTFAPNFDDEFKDISVHALDNDSILIQVLLWNPNCEEVDHRQKTLPERNIKEDIKQNVKFLQHVYNEAKNDSRSRLQLKLYNYWAPFALYATDQGASVGFFMNGKLAVNGAQLVVTKNTPCFDEFTGQFKKIWGTEEKLFDFPRNDPMRVLDECYR